MVFLEGVELHEEEEQGVENELSGDKNSSILDITPDFLPVETILKEDEGNLIISNKNKM